MATMEVPGIGQVQAQDCEFSIIRETQAVYETEDPAIRVRVRTVVTRILVAKDADGKTLCGADGQPVVSVTTMNLVTTEC